MIRGDNKPRQLAWNQVPSDPEELDLLIATEQGGLSKAEEELLTRPTKWTKLLLNRHSGVPNLGKGVVIESQMNKDELDFTDKKRFGKKP
jgi:hypothetical protein